MNWGCPFLLIPTILFDWFLGSEKLDVILLVES